MLKKVATDTAGNFIYKGYCLTCKGHTTFVFCPSDDTYECTGCMGDARTHEIDHGMILKGDENPNV